MSGVPKVVRALGICSMAVIGGCAAPPASVSDVYLGNWQGSVSQAASPRQLSVEVSIVRDQARRSVGTTFYPALGCRGELTLKSANSESIKVIETFSSDAQKCGAGREFSLIWAFENRLMYVSANPIGQGTLFRSSAVGAASSPASRPTTPSEPSVGEFASSIDSGLLRWQYVWQSDRYVNGSPRVTEILNKGSSYVVRGTFALERKPAFLERQSAPVRLPFSAELQRFDKGLALSGLCMQDTRTPNAPTNCYDAEQVLAKQQRDALRGALMLGLAAAIATSAGGEAELDCFTFSETTQPSFANGTDLQGRPTYSYRRCYPKR